MLFAAGVALTVTPLRAEEPKPEMKCACMKGHEAKKQEMEKKMEAKMKAEAAELDKLVDEMNTSTGDRKMEAMAAALNKIVQKHKAMHEKMAGMSMMKKMGGEKSEEAESSGEDDKPKDEVKKADDPHAEHH